MSKLVTGKNAVLTINGNPVTMWKQISDPFDDWWSNKYSIKCTRLTGQYTLDYTRIYLLYEFLWKLKVIRLS